MRRLWPLFGTLMLAALLWTSSAARAAELAGCFEVAAESAGHFEGDKDQVPADPDNGTPHHHSPCHGHCASVVNESDAGPIALDSVRTLGCRREMTTAGCDPGTTLRPPIA